MRNRVFVNGRSRDTIKQDIKARVDRGNVQLERSEAIKVRPTWSIGKYCADDYVPGHV